MKILSKLFTLFIAVAVFTSCVSKKKYDDAVAAAQAEKSALQSEIASAQEENSKLEEQASKLQNDLNLSSKEIADLETTVKSNTDRIKLLQDAIVGAFSTYNPNDVKVELKDNKLYVQLENSILFKPGRAKIEKSASSAIEQFAGVIKSNPDLHILVEGHADSDPVKIHKAKYGDNWGLSASRALSIVRELESLGVDGKQLTASGKGANQPVDMADTKEAKAKNRRTEFVISPKIDDLFELYKSDLSGSGR